MQTFKTKPVIALLTVVSASIVCLAAPATTPKQKSAPPKSTPPSLTGRWSVDPMHTSIGFSIPHCGISIVQGRFNDVSGTVNATAGHPEASRVSFVIQAASIDTNVKMRDDDLRSDKYFDVKKYPTISFNSTRIRSTKTGYVAQGYLSMHGVTKLISLPFQLKGPITDHFAGTRFGLVSEIHLNRMDYGVGDNYKIDTGVLAIGTDVDISIGLEAVRGNMPKM